MTDFPPLLLWVAAGLAWGFGGILLAYFLFPFTGDIESPDDEEA
jgi:hypothetical protein